MSRKLLSELVGGYNSTLLSSFYAYQNVSLVWLIFTWKCCRLTTLYLNWRLSVLGIRFMVILCCFIENERVSECKPVHNVHIPLIDKYETIYSFREYLKSYNEAGNDNYLNCYTPPEEIHVPNDALSSSKCYNRKFNFFFLNRSISWIQSIFVKCLLNLLCVLNEFKHEWRWLCIRFEWNWETSSVKTFLYIIRNSEFFIITLNTRNDFPFRWNSRMPTPASFIVRQLESVFRTEISFLSVWLANKQWHSIASNMREFKC